MTDSTDSAGFVEVSGGIIIARMRGTPDAASLRDVQERILVLMSDTGINRILYDALELEAPSVDEVLVQQQLTEEFKPRGARVAFRLPRAPRLRACGPSRRVQRLVRRSSLAFGVVRACRRCRRSWHLVPRLADLALRDEPVVQRPRIARPMIMPVRLDGRRSMIGDAVTSASPRRHRRGDLARSIPVRLGRARPIEHEHEYEYEHDRRATAPLLDSSSGGILEEILSFVLPLVVMLPIPLAIGVVPGHLIFGLPISGMAVIGGFHCASSCGASAASVRRVAPHCSEL